MLEPKPLNQDSQPGPSRVSISMQRLTEKLASYRKQNEEDNKEREVTRGIVKTPRVVQEFKPIKRNNKWKVRTLSKGDNEINVVQRKSFAQV